jgi:hypothetical protein
MVAGSSWFGQRIIHRKGQTAEKKLKQLEYQIAATARFIRYELPELIQGLADTTVTEHEMIEIIASLPISDTHKQWCIAKITRPEFRREADQANNLWILWNLANEAIGTNYRSETRFFERNLNLVDDIVFLYNSLVSEERAVA